MTRSRYFPFVVALAACSVASGELLSLSQPDLDRWMYPFNGSPGARTSASIFGAQGNAPSFDERDAQFLLGFNTGSGGVPTGLSPENYQISSVTLTAKTNIANTFAYDPSSDSYTTYLTPGTPLAQSDADTGRPIELFGMGFRNGRTMLEFGASNTAAGPGFEEAEQFSPPGAPAWKIRNAFAADVATGVIRDVSNHLNFSGANLTPGDSDDGVNGFNPGVFAVGQSALAPGALVPADTVFTFNVNLSDAQILQYLQQGLSAGQLGFVISSFHQATFGGDPTFPSFYTKEAVGSPSFPNAAGVSLAIQYEIVPEPAAGMLLLVGLPLLAGRSRRRAS